MFDIDVCQGKLYVLFISQILSVTFTNKKKTFHAVAHCGVKWIPNNGNVKSVQLTRPGLFVLHSGRKKPGRSVFAILKFSRRVRHVYVLQQKVDDTLCMAHPRSSYSGALRRRGTSCKTTLLDLVIYTRLRRDTGVASRRTRKIYGRTRPADTITLDLLFN